MADKPLLTTDDLDPDPNPNPDPDPNPNLDPDPDPNSDPDPDPDLNEEGKLTAEEWEEQRRKDVPASADDYALPEIEGFDKEKAANSPIMKTMREAAHKAGLKQEDFDGFVKTYVEAEAEEVNARHDAEMAQLGPDEAAIEARITKVAAAVVRTLPKEEADAVLASATTAAAVKGIERLLSRQPTRTGDPPAEQKDSWETIDKLMMSDAYSGNESQRDPEVIRRVDKYFAEGGKRGG